ncbi:two-component system sensor histidine kinase CreC [Luteimonas sp. 50]|uniref:histidine kinase n=1 Tax=Cognatiluteimonas sedimenti TaxID=2927791 RepID=A0ABT0A2S1_9GAMM|nr:two-component system sensor histidine kinase CreC [Lysobacter sedimenti]MCJ0825245.1 two-component system sensor histidine kinase CreC [Lysobacter sedimenti]
MRIGLRILLGTFAIVALAALLLTQVFVAQVKPGVRQAMEDTLVDTANVLAELASDDMLAGRIADGRFAQRVRQMRARDPGAEIWGFPKRTTNYRIYVTDARGIVVFDSSDRDVGRDYSRWNDVHRTLRGQYGARSTAQDPGDPESTVMHVAAPIRDAGGRIVGVLTVAKPNRTLAPFIARSQATVLWWGVLLLALALLVGVGAATWLSRQLGALRRYAQAVTAGERAPLPRVAGEFAELGHSLEAMRAQLEGKQYVERYVHALTHEMKSPLAAIRASAELLETPLPAGDQARFAAAVRSQSERLALMIDRMLALAAVEHRQRLEAPAPVALAELVAAVAEDNRARLAARAQALAIDVDPATRVRGDAFLLRQALDNLVENASDFAPAGSTIEVDARSDDDQVLVRVGDRGPGIPDYARDRVFERFYSLPRPDGGHRSSGLGLAFVAQVADLHGGSATLDDRPGGGACATLRLPAIT